MKIKSCHNLYLSKIKAYLNKLARLKKENYRLQCIIDLYQEAFSILPIIILITDNNGSFTFIDPNVKNIIGYSKIEVKKLKNISRLFKLIQCDLNNSKKKVKVDRGNYSILTKSGEVRQLSVSVSIIPNYDGEQCVYIFQDITKSYATHDVLTNLFEQSMVMLFIIDLKQSKFIKINQEVCRILGFSEEELMTNYFIERIHPDDREKLLVELVLLSKGKSLSNLRIRHLTADSQYKLLELTATCDSSHDYAYAMAFDVTERFNQEQQMRQAQKMEAIGHLAGGVAHDFNNLLTVILGYSDLTLSQVEKIDETYENLLQIKQAGQKAQILTRQLLAFSRKQVLKPEVLDLNQLLQELEKMLRRIIGEDIELFTIYCPNLNTIKADPGQLEQVILNLVVNARDAMLKGGKLTIETDNIFLDEKYTSQHPGSNSGMHVMLAISDNGTGMDDNIKSHIFEPFFTTKRRGEGTGLGLATVYGIVKQSGGSIYVYSEQDKGTVFKIFFKALKQDLKPLLVKQKSDLNIKGTETILVVEDEDAVRKLIVLTLKQYGYDVYEATSGINALKLICDFNYSIQLLLTDVIMPGIDGRDFAKQVKTLFPDICVLYMSGYTGNTIVQHGVLDKSKNFLQKPFTPVNLLKKIREVLDQKK